MIQQASQLCVTSTTISSQLKRSTPLMHRDMSLMSMSLIQEARLHIKVISCVYHSHAHLQTGGISQGLVDLIGYHFMSHQTSISIHQLYAHILTTARINI